MSIIMLDTFNYAMDTITGQFAEVRGHALNRLGDKAGAAAAGSSDSFALTWGGAAPMPEVDDTRFMPAPMAFLNGLPPDVRKTIGLLKSDGGEADHTKACPLYWTAAAKRVTDRLDKLLTFVGGNAKTHFGAMFSKCSFEMEYGERITVRKGSQFSVGARGHLTVHTDGNEFVNIGEVYDENANTTKPANAKKKKKTTTDGQEQEPPQAATKKQKVDAAKPGGADPGSVLAAAPAPAGGGAKAGGVTFGKTSIAPGKVVKFGVRPNTPLARPVGPTYEEYVGLEKVIYDFGLCTGTTQGKVKIANEAERKEEDGTRYRYVRYDSSGGHSSDLWAPPNGWADSLQKNTKRRDAGRPSTTPSSRGSSPPLTLGLAAAPRRSARSTRTASPRRPSCWKRTRSGGSASRGWSSYTASSTTPWPPPSWGGSASRPSPAPTARHATACQSKACSLTRSAPS